GIARGQPMPLDLGAHLGWRPTSSVRNMARQCPFRHLSSPRIRCNFPSHMPYDRLTKKHDYLSQH
ncbi:hypothetical protein, partial [Mesorhizobium amorphae]|uniref:hypothetical protein n=1 Tax=Mesorhizobium amorphae TaxID=71433 RepID=UPI001AEC5901